MVSLSANYRNRAPSSGHSSPPTRRKTALGRSHSLTDHHGLTPAITDASRRQRTATLHPAHLKQHRVVVIRLPGKSGFRHPHTAARRYLASGNSSSDASNQGKRHWVVAIRLTQTVGHGFEPRSAPRGVGSSVGRAIVKNASSASSSRAIYQLTKTRSSLSGRCHFGYRLVRGICSFESSRR